MCLRSIVCMVVALISSAISAVPQSQHSFKIYRDPSTGVSFIYPGNWTSDPESLFSADSALLLKPDSERKPSDPTAYDIAHTKVGLRFHAPQTDREAGGAAFVYALLPENNDVGCRRRATRSFGEDDKSANDVTIGNIVFTHVSASDSGLGHSRNREIYVSFLGGKCYGFEEQVDTFDIDGWSEETLVKNMKAELNATMKSVRVGKSSVTLGARH